MEVRYNGEATPKQNYLVELGFTTMAKREMAMMTKAHLSQDIRLKLCKQAFMFATLLDNLIPKLLMKKVTGPAFVQNMRTFRVASPVKKPKVGCLGTDEPL